MKPQLQNKLDESPCPFLICFTKPLVLPAPFSSWILAFAPVLDISFGTTHSNFCMAELYRKHLFIKTHGTFKSNKANRKTSPLSETQLSTFLWRSAQKYHRCFFTCILLQTKTVSFIRWFPNVVQSWNEVISQARVSKDMSVWAGKHKSHWTFLCYLPGITPA